MQLHFWRSIYLIKLNCCRVDLNFALSSRQPVYCVVRYVETVGKGPVYWLFEELEEREAKQRGVRSFIRHEGLPADATPRLCTISHPVSPGRKGEEGGDAYKREIGNLIFFAVHSIDYCFMSLFSSNRFRTNVHEGTFMVQAPYVTYVTNLP